MSNIKDRNKVWEDKLMLLDIISAKSRVENLVRLSVNRWCDMKDELYKKDTKEVSDRAIDDIFSQFRQSFTHSCSLLT
jgi:hypothetical protein